MHLENMGRTPPYVKLRIISLLLMSKSINAIVRQLQKEGFKIRQHTVARIIKQFKECRSLTDKPAPGHESIVTREHLDFIDAKLEENDELPAPGKTLKQ